MSRRFRFEIRATAADISDLDWLADELGVGRSDAVRQLVRETRAQRCPIRLRQRALLIAQASRPLQLAEAAELARLADQAPLDDDHRSAALADATSAVLENQQRPLPRREGPV